MPGRSRSKNGVAPLAYGAGHPRLSLKAASKTWMAGTSPAMTILDSMLTKKTLKRRLLALQRQRLVAEHAVDDHLAGGVEIDAVVLHQIRSVFNDGVDVLLDLQALVMVVLAEAHALADDLQDVHDLERPVALVRAQFAMIGVIHRDQRIDLGGACGLELLQLQLGLELRQARKVDALQTDAWHVELDDLDARHRPQ